MASLWYDHTQVFLEQQKKNYKKKKNRKKSLTKNRYTRTSRLTRSAVHIEIGMAARTPLAQYAGASMNDVHKMGIAFVQIPCIIRAGIEKYGRIQTGYSSDFPLVGRKVVGHQASNMGANTVANEM